jgi:K+-sensing histidine kinase KdpD
MARTAAHYLHAAFLALATGVGLFVVGGARGPGPWAFVAIALVVYVAASWMLAPPKQSRRRNDDSLPESESPGVELPPVIEPTVAPLVSSETDASADGIDYLTALRHELRTPLNAVLGFSDVLLSGIDGEVNPSQREDLEIIRASGIRLRVLLDSALDMTQLADEELRLDVDRVDVRELVSRAAVEATQLWSNKRRASCTLPDEACFAHADEGRLRRCILVLADFLATSHRDADIVVALAPSNGHFSIEITAESSGRPTLETLPTTAEVLAAEDVSTIRQWPVAVTSELVGHHGGSLYHGSAPSRFLIRLPAGSAP